VRPIPRPAIDLIAVFEGFSGTPYVCAGGYTTIGYGHVIRDHERFDEPSTQDQGRTLLRKHAGIAARGVAALTHVPLTDGEYGVLVSFVFNLGAGNYQRSTLRMKLNRGEYIAAAEEFWKWRRAGGIILRGLVRRHPAEKAMFLGAP